MGHKNQFWTPISFQSTSPITGFLPTNAYTSNIGSVPSGNYNGAMASTNTIYSQIIDLSKFDNIGAEVVWSGSPTGTLTINGSVSGINFPALTFDPVLAQPGGAPGSYLIDLSFFPFKYILFEYTNASGSGTLNIWLQAKDAN